MNRSTIDEKPFGRLRLEAKAARLALEDARGEWARFGSALRQARSLIAEAGFGASEIRQLGLLSPRSSPGQVLALTRAAMMEINASLNPAAFRARVARKDLFAEECERIGLPVPRLLGIFRRLRPGWSLGGAVPAGLEDWCRAIVEDWPDEFVIKAALGGHGRSVGVFARTGRDRFRSSVGTSSDARELVSFMERAAGRYGCVIQERSRNHAEIERLSGSGYLQTARLYTILDRDGTPRLLHAYFKLITGDNCVDNFRSGKTGNVLTVADCETGKLTRGFSPGPRGRLVELIRHPDTGRRIEGFALPDWERVKSLAFRAAGAFAPLRLVGWDIAVGASGPILIEGNWNSDPPNVGGRMDRVLADIEDWGGDALVGGRESKGVARALAKPRGSRVANALEP